MKKKLMKIFLISMVSILLFSIGYLFTNTLNSLANSNKKIDVLKDSSSFIGYSYKYNMNFYKSNYKSFDSPSFQINDDKLCVGSDGDILCSTKSNVGNIISQSLISFFFYGHSVMILHDGLDTFETNGNDYYTNASTYKTNNWLANASIIEFIGLKVNTSQEIKNKVCELSANYLNIRYNYSFLFNRKKSFYCSDLLTNLYDQFGVFIDKDDLYTSPLDIAGSSSCDIFCYKEINQNVDDLHPGRFNFYYVDDGIDYLSYIK